MKAKRFRLAAFLLAVIGALVAAFAPTGQSMESSFSISSSLSGPVQTVSRSYRVSMFQTNGAWVLVVVLVPVLVALIPVLVRHRKAAIVSAVLLWTSCVIGAFSVGMFFIPAAVLMTVAAARQEPALVSPTQRS
ncbi:MAG: hypothetical protein M3P11_11240 [Actinomycetota bacterium]|nr:hypothetical protein [Actinomycetota bacterium]